MIFLFLKQSKPWDSTPNQPDFTYTITVGTHGDYPKTPVIANPVYTVSGVDDEEKKNQWTYYVNQLNEVDTFLNDLITELSKRDEDTIVVAFGGSSSNHGSGRLRYEIR